MRTREQVEVGEEVRVFDVNGNRLGQPPGGWPGQVVKAGPKLVTVTYSHGTSFSGATPGAVTTHSSISRTRRSTRLPSAPGWPL